MHKYPSISIAIPAYNEEENLEWVVKNSLKELPRYFRDFEVIIIDDGSTDKTAIIADKLQFTYPRVKVIHQKNSGYSKAMLTGIKAARKEFVAYMPADGQFLVSDMRHCFEVLKGNDLVLGYRGGRADYSTMRVIYSYIFLLILLFLFNIKYMDVGWVNIWQTKKVQALRLSAIGGIFILTEIVVRFMKKGYRITEAPSYYRPRKSGEVKNGNFKIAFLTGLSAVKLWWQLTVK